MTRLGSKKKGGGGVVKGWGRQGRHFLTSQESSKTDQSTRVDRLFMFKQVQCFLLTRLSAGLNFN